MSSTRWLKVCEADEMRRTPWWVAGYGAAFEELIDSEGRVLGEHVSSDYEASRERVLRFRDVRDTTGFPTNVDALAQVDRHWPWVIQLLAREGGRDLASMLEQARVPFAAALLHFRREQPMPAHLAAAYKATIGYGQVLRMWSLEGLTDVGPDPRGFLAALDHGRWLIGDHLVCPGSRRAIAEAYAALSGDLWPEEPALRALPDEMVTLRAEALELARTLSAFEAMSAALYFRLNATEERVPSLERFAGFGETRSPFVTVFQILEHTPMRDARGARRLTRDARVTPFFEELDGPLDAVVERFAATCESLFGERFDVETLNELRR